MASCGSGVRCALSYCNSSYSKNKGEERISFFGFPKDANLCATWVKKCNVIFLPTSDLHVLSARYKLCSLHFENRMFSNFQKNRIYPHALPTLGLLEIVETPLMDSDRLDSPKSD